MLNRVIKWLKQIFKRALQALSSQRRISSQLPQKGEKKIMPPLSDTDLEFLFTELLAGVRQVKGRTWARNWLQQIEHRVTTEQWLDWLRKFGNKLLKSKNPHNEIASRLVQLGELDVGEVGDLAYEIGMELLTRIPIEPIWEYDGPDNVESPAEENLSPGEQIVSQDDLLAILRENEPLRRQICQDLQIDSDDPQVILEGIINQPKENL
jgi:hypothetical protein